MKDTEKDEEMEELDELEEEFVALIGDAVSNLATVGSGSLSLVGSDGAGLSPCVISKPSMFVFVFCLG